MNIYLAGVSNYNFKKALCKVLPNYKSSLITLEWDKYSFKTRVDIIDIICRIENVTPLALVESMEGREKLYPTADMMLGGNSNV